MGRTHGRTFGYNPENLLPLTCLHSLGGMSPLYLSSHPFLPSRSRDELDGGRVEAQCSALASRAGEAGNSFVPGHPGPPSSCLFYPDLSVSNFHNHVWSELTGSPVVILCPPPMREGKRPLSPSRCQGTGLVKVQASDFQSRPAHQKWPPAPGSSLRLEQT